MTRSRASLLLAFLLAGASVSACAALWGFQDTIGPVDGSADGSLDDRPSHEGARDSGKDTRDAYEAPDVGDAPPPSDAKVADPCNPPAAETYAVFVAEHEGVDGTGCGLSVSSPCKTIGAGISSALGATPPRTIINVAQGTYPEQVAPKAGGFTLVGGWLENSGKWARAPSSTAREKAKIQPVTESMTVVANSLGSSPATLCTLTVASKDSADPGQSLYGVFATGSTKLTLKDVLVQVSPGGKGSPGQDGDAGAPGNKAGCGASVGSGAPGAEAGANGASAEAGTFSASGFAPGSGGSGTPGEPGTNGMAGGQGSCLTYINSCKLIVVSLLCANTTATECGADGGAGCGGKGGGPATGGGGGGSSVGVFAWGADVTVEGNSLIVTGNGGNGSAGGQGGEGGAGGAGVAGATGASQPTTCKKQTMPTRCVEGTNLSPAGGLPGTPGGDGTPGGAGGGGSGGFSCPIVQGGGGSVTSTASTTDSGTPGNGAGGAPPGGTANASGICSF